MRHTLLYNSTILLVTARDTVPRFQCFTELHEAYPIHHTRLMSLHMNEIIFCVQASCRAADNELVADGAKYVSSRGCFAEVPHIRPYSLWCTLWRCSLTLLVVEWLANASLHSLHTTLSVGSTSLQSTAQNPKYFQTSL